MRSLGFCFIVLFLFTKSLERWKLVLNLYFIVLERRSLMRIWLHRRFSGITIAIAVSGEEILCLLWVVWELSCILVIRITGIIYPWLCCIVWDRLTMTIADMTVNILLNHAHLACIHNLPMGQHHTHSSNIAVFEELGLRFWWAYHIIGKFIWFLTSEVFDYWVIERTVKHFVIWLDWTYVIYKRKTSNTHLRHFISFHKLYYFFINGLSG